jgi:hypothetical protein
VKAVNVSAVKAIPKERVYLSRAGATEEQLIALRRDLVEGGAEKINTFVGLGIVGCEVPVPSNLAETTGKHGFASYYEASFSSGPQRAAIGMEDVMWVRGAYAAAERIAAGGPGALPADFSDRVLTASPDVIEKSRRLSEQRYGQDPVDMADGGGGRALQQNSEFMIGHTVVIMVYPESTGPDENWTNAELRDANLGGVEGCLAFQATFSYLPMSFTFYPRERVATQFEPIQHSMDTDADTWILESMQSLGYAEPRADLAVHAMNEEARKRWGSDWVYTVFVADSRNEPGHVWQGGSGGAGYTAYANLGGPYMVMPFPAGANDPNDIGEIGLYSRIFQHEMGHVFWTLDEYRSSPSLCTARSGYLNYANGNKVGTFLGPNGEEVGCNPLVDCIMRNPRIEERPWCKFSKGFMGVIDANNNGIPDVFDARPTVEFEGGLNDTIDDDSYDGTYIVRAKAISLAVPNRNPFMSNFAIDYAAPLKSTTLSVNGVGATRLSPLDGRWDEPEEDLSVTLTGLSAGKTRVQLKVVNSFGATSTLLEKQVYYVGVVYSQFNFEVHPDSIVATWKTVGATFGAKFDLLRINTQTGDTITVQSDVTTPDVGKMFRNYRSVDSSTERGAQYKYFVKGYFSFRGKPYTPTSDEFVKRAPLPITAGAVSFASPNPFTSMTTVTVDVPHSFAASGDDAPNVSFGPAVEIETDVEVAVFDVAGRPVKRLFAGKMYGRVETFVWDGTNSRNELVPSGVYFLRTSAGPVHDVKKVVVVR